MLRFRPLSRWSWRERRLWAEQLQDAGTEKPARFHPHQYVFKSCHVWRVHFCMCVCEKNGRKSRSFSCFPCKNKTQTVKKSIVQMEEKLKISCCEMCRVSTPHLWIYDGQWYKKLPRYDTITSPHICNSSLLLHREITGVSKWNCPFGWMRIGFFFTPPSLRM